VLRVKATDRPYNVLFLCTGNSARSIMAESLLREIGGGRFHAYSAGSQPKGRVHPKSVGASRVATHPDGRPVEQGVGCIRQTGRAAMDFVITVCDNAAGEVCPVWPGQPTTAHWSIPVARMLALTKQR